MLVVVIGGAGWLWGGVLGAIAFKLMHDLLSAWTPQYWTFWLGLFLVVLVMVGRDRLLEPWPWGAGHERPSSCETRNARQALRRPSQRPTTSRCGSRRARATR